MRQFSDLTPEEKIEAILANTSQPVPKDFILTVADLDLNQLQDEARGKIDDLLRRWMTHEGTIENNTVSGSDNPTPRNAHYWIPLDAQSDVMQRIAIDPKKVKAHISRIGRSELRTFLDQRRKNGG